MISLPTRHLICLIGLLFALGAQAKPDQANCLTHTLKRLCSAGDREYDVQNLAPVSRLTSSEQNLLKPDVQVETLGGGKIQMGLRNFRQFENTTHTLKDKGVFTFFIPSGEGSQVPAGHMGIVINGSYFDRNLDSQGAEAVRSLTPEEFSRLFQHFPYAVAQFYEVSDGAIASLGHYFHERTWHYHANSPGFHTSYVALPFNSDKPLSEVENCNTFVFSFLEPYWRKKYSDLNRVSSEFGPFHVNEAPANQLLNDTRSVSYRGSLFITEQDKFKKGLFSDGLRNDYFGHQLLLASPAQPLGAAH